MSLLKRNKDKQLAAERKLAAQHAIVKMGVDRNVRDSYFNGLVFAAVANDDQIDESERARLFELGEALELATDDVVEAIQCLSDMGDDAKMDVIEESARQLMNVDVAECFLKEFEELWTIGGGNKGELDEFKSQLIGWMGDDVMAVEEAKAKVAAEAEAKRIAEEAEAKRLEAARKAVAEEKKIRRENEKRQESEKLHKFQDEVVESHSWRTSINELDIYRIKDRIRAINLEKLDFKSEIERSITYCCGDDYPSYKKPEEEVRKDYRGILSMTFLLYLKDETPDYYAIQRLEQALVQCRLQNIKQCLKEFSHQYLGA